MAEPSTPDSATGASVGASGLTVTVSLAKGAALDTPAALTEGGDVAQALLGQIYFDGAEGVQRQRAMGLMYLTMARENAGDRKSQQWIVDAYDHAMATANSADRQGALAYLRDHLDGRRP